MFFRRNYYFICIWDKYIFPTPLQILISLLNKSRTTRTLLLLISLHVYVYTEISYCGILPSIEPNKINRDEMRYTDISSIYLSLKF